MRIHHLQHVPFEGLGSMEPYLRVQGHQLSSTHLYRGDALPRVDDIDWLIVMGGPMGVCDESLYPWLVMEKTFISEAITAGKTLLGICLGAQLIADVMGAKVSKNAYREIGWFPIEAADTLAQTALKGVLPETLDVFHWHGDTFEIPADASSLASSEACLNQGFNFDDRVIGLQFHLETTMESAQALIENCRHELDGSRYVQTEQAMLSHDARFKRINAVMQSLLQRLEK